MGQNEALMIFEGTFELFGRAHLVTLLVIAGVSLTLPLWARSWSAARVDRVARGLALGLVLYRTGYIPVVAWLYGDPVRDLLPLHVCGLLFYICAFVLWKRDQLAYEIAYFWGMGGTLQALLTPEMNRPFPDPTFFSHFAGHGVLLVAIFYATLTLGMRPMPGSVLRALGATLGYAALLLPLNLLLGTNYMYLVSKPAAASILDILGPWPWYIGAAIALALVSYLIWYLPFLAADLVRRRTSPAIGRR